MEKRKPSIKFYGSFNELKHDRIMIENEKIKQNNALEFIKSKHNGEIPYQYGSRECAKLMTEFADFICKKNNKLFTDLLKKMDERILYLESDDAKKEMSEDEIMYRERETILAVIALQTAVLKTFNQ